MRTMTTATTAAFEQAYADAQQCGLPPIEPLPDWPAPEEDRSVMRRLARRGMMLLGSASREVTRRQFRDLQLRRKRRVAAGN